MQRLHRPGPGALGCVVAPRGIIPVFARKPIFGYKAIAFSTVAIGFFSMLVWAHHMFTVGMPSFLNAFFMVASMVIAVPTGVKIFNWLATLWRGNLHFDTAMLYGSVIPIPAARSAR